MNRRTFLAGTGSLLLADAPPAPSRIIDAHTHFYDPTRPQGVPWPGKSNAILYKPTLPERFGRLTAPLGVTGTMVIEASNWVEDNQWLLDLARDNPVIVGVTGNLDAGIPEFKERLERFAKNPLFRGIRSSSGKLSKSIGDAHFLSDMERLAGLDLELDIGGGPEMFPGLMRLNDRVPGLRIVINHLPFDPPRDEQAFRELGKRPAVYAKVSGVLRRKDGVVSSELSSYRAPLEELWEVFGPDRVIYGSNWPVSDMFAPYPDVLRVVAGFFAAKGQPAMEKYFWKNSLAAYKWIGRT